MNLNSKINKYISKDLFFTAQNQMWRLISGPLMLLFIPLFLTPEIQGYWFSFISLSALSIFADLGFTNIVLQFAAHEFAYLSFNKQIEIEGDENHLKKLASFFVFTIKWAFGMILFVFPIILIVGIFIFNEKHLEINWLIPWFIYLLASAISFFNTTILSFIEGCNSVAKSQKIRFNISIINTIVILLLLYLKFNLYALAIASIISSSLICIYFLTTFKKLISQLIKSSRKFKYSWKKEFLELLWRYAISFASGYFIFQIYTPLMFEFSGPVEAGKVGISIALWTAIFGISNVWIVAITPKLNILVSRREWEKLDKIFLRNMILSIITFILGSIVMFTLLILLKDEVKIISRFLGIFAMGSLAISWFLQLIINSMATYLRAHKQEPLVIPSVVSAIYILLSTFICAKYLPSKYLFIGFASSYIFSFPWISYIFYKRRKVWHINE